MHIRIGDKVMVKDTGRVGIVLTINLVKNEYTVDIGADGPLLTFQRNQIEFVI